VLPSRESWSTQQLAEFLEAVSAFGDEESAIRGAVEQAAEILEAEAGAMVNATGVLASVGFPAGAAPDDELAAAARGEAAAIEVPGVGACAVEAAAVEDERAPGWLVLARAGQEFTREEAILVRGMGRVLSLVLRMLGALQEERGLRERLEERQALLERLAKIQRSIVQRADRQEVLDAIVTGAVELLGDDVAVLRLRDPEDPASTVAVASRGMAPEVVDDIRHGDIATTRARRRALRGSPPPACRRRWPRRCASTAPSPGASSWAPTGRAGPTRPPSRRCSSRSPSTRASP
jgi:hypothetical protein